MQQDGTQQESGLGQIRGLLVFAVDDVDAFVATNP